MTTRELALLLAQRIFDSVKGSQAGPQLLADRIEFKAHRPERRLGYDGEEFGLGGYCKSALADRLSVILLELRVAPPASIYDNCLQGYAR